MYIYQIKNKNKMKQIIILILISFSVMNISGQSSFYDFKVKDINGNEFDFNQLRGKKVLIVNTASKCGFTPQYAELEKFYEEHKDKNFIIIGFPANNFLGQEPGTNEEIKAFCQKNYGVSFPMMAKIEVRGNNIHPLYKWLTSKSLNGVEDSNIKWNFQKYLIDEEGKIIQILNPRTSVKTLDF